MDRNNNNNNNNEKQEKKQPPNISQFRGTKYNKYEYNIQQNIIKNNKENIPPIEEGETNKYLITDNLINKKDNTSSIKKNIYSFIKDDEKKDL